MTTDKDRSDKEHDPKEPTAKERADKERAGRIDNQNQDPNHPANKTLSPHRDPAPRSEAEAFGMTSDELMTEQEKAAAPGVAATAGSVPGVGPAPSAEVTTGPVETIEDQGIGPRTPYPTGNPPAPDVEATRSQGIKGATPKNAPDKPLVREPHR